MGKRLHGAARARARRPCREGPGAGAWSPPALVAVGALCGAERGPRWAAGRGLEGASPARGFSAPGRRGRGEAGRPRAFREKERQKVLAARGFPGVYLETLFAVSCLKCAEPGTALSSHFLLRFPPRAGLSPCVVTAACGRPPPLIPRGFPNRGAAGRAQTPGPGRAALPSAAPFPAGAARVRRTCSMRCEGSTVPLSAAGCADGPGRPASRPCPFLLFPSLFPSPVSPPTRRRPAGEGSLPWFLSCPLCVPFSFGLQKGRGGGWGAPGEEDKSAGSDACLRAQPELRGNPGPRSVPPRCVGVARAGVASSSAQRQRGGACAMQDPRGHGGPEALRVQCPFVCGVLGQ